MNKPRRHWIYCVQFMLILSGAIAFSSYRRFREIVPTAWATMIFFDVLFGLFALFEIYPAWNLGRKGDWLNEGFASIFWLVWCSYRPRHWLVHHRH